MKPGAEDGREDWFRETQLISDGWASAANLVASRRLAPGGAERAHPGLDAVGVGEGQRTEVRRRTRPVQLIERVEEARGQPVETTQRPSSSIRAPASTLIME